MRRIPFINRVSFTALATTLAFGASLAVGVGGAQAVVVDMSAVGSLSATVPYNPADQNYGVALVPAGSSTSGQTPGQAQLGPVHIPTAGWSAPCFDPAIPPDLSLNGSSLCEHGGSVLHNNETYALTWDPLRRYWATTRNYLEQFLSDVAAASGTGVSPFALTPQYSDAGGRAGNASLFGGGCIDYGSQGGASCQFGNYTLPPASGNDYPSSGCSAYGANPSGGTNGWPNTPNGPFGSAANDLCLTDAQIAQQVSTTVSQTGLLGHVKPGYTPLLDVLLPAGVVTCLNSGATLCSANSTAPAQFCSYHAQVNVGGTEVTYVVLPWVAHTTRGSLCDDSDAPQIPNPVPVDQLATDVGARLVSPLAQGEMAAITDPAMNGWAGLTGNEINDNFCAPLGNSNGLDNVTINGHTYPIQREFNNAGSIETDPNALPCQGVVNLVPTFVVPSAVNPGDEIQFDGSTTVSTLMIGKANYAWNFGDGTTGVGPSVVHSYSAGGNYTVKLTVTDRGGTTASISQLVQVLGANGLPVPPGQTPTPTPPAGSGPSPGASGLTVHVQLMPQSLKSVLGGGMSIRVSSNMAADGIATVYIPHSAAKRAHIKGSGSTVRIGLGTVQVKNGTATLHVRLSKATAAKLRKLGHVTLTLRLALVAPGGVHRAFVAAGRY